MTDANSAVMRGGGGIPILNKFARADGEAITAFGVAGSSAKHDPITCLHHENTESAPKTIKHSKNSTEFH